MLKRKKKWLAQQNGFLFFQGADGYGSCKIRINKSKTMETVWNRVYLRIQ